MSECLKGAIIEQRLTLIEQHDVWSSAQCTFFKTKEADYWCRRVSEGKGNSRKLWQSLSGSMNTTNSNSISTDDTVEDTAKFFTQKVDDIREEISKAPTLDIPAGTSVKFETLTPVSIQEIVQLFQYLNSKACELDPIPSRIIKQHATILAPYSTALFSKSWAGGVFPDALKEQLLLLF